MDEYWLKNFNSLQKVCLIRTKIDAKCSIWNNHLKLQHGYASSLSVGRSKNDRTFLNILFEGVKLVVWAPKNHIKYISLMSGKSKGYLEAEFTRPLVMVSFESQCWKTWSLGNFTTKLSQTLNKILWNCL